MIAIASDHGGFNLKNEIMMYLDKLNIPYEDYGAYSKESTDYPIYAKKVVQAIYSKKADKGILICGTGLGISIAANRYKNIRCAVCHDVFSAKATREHNNSNILAMGERVIGVGAALEVVSAFLNTDFSGDIRHIRRIESIEPTNGDVSD